MFKILFCFTKMGDLAAQMTPILEKSIVCVINDKYNFYFKLLDLIALHFFY